MDPLRRQRIGELFAAANLLDGECRIAFLKRNCGDDQDLFEQLKSLLDIDVREDVLDCEPTVSKLGIPDIVASRFRVIRYIAEGGMGTVYEAEDLQLHDHVALKTIRPEIASNPRAVERFKREIHLGKTVTHPNVCRVHDLVVDRTESGNEVFYLSMQFLDGETLASRIKRGPLPKTEALPLIEDMANALYAAHQADIIHRDFKSGNVMLVKRFDRTHAVITDFGLARAVRVGDTQTLTNFAGTVDYMAPEQICGQELTPAADIYALGVVMYEMVTGERPFTGNSKGTVARKHLNEEPRPPKGLVPSLDADWNDAILRCLKKAPGERFQSTDEVKTAFSRKKEAPREWRDRPARRAMTWRSLAVLLLISSVLLVLGAIPSVRQTAGNWLHLANVPHVGQLAVLPLMVPADDPEGAALEYGLADTLATRLIMVEGSRPLQIIPASEIRSKGVTTLEQARQEFGVNLGLELSVRRSSEMVRINYLLVDAKTHQELRGDTITAPISDGFAIEDRVADSVVKALELDLQPQEREVLAQHGTQQAVAYDLYLQGRGYLEEYQKSENIESAITVFKHALERDPHYALALAGLGEAYWRKYEIHKDRDAADRAKGACESAVSFGENDADAHTCLGLIDAGTGKYDDAIQQYQFALRLEPANDSAIRGLASAFQAAGRTADAEKTYKNAIAARPNYWLGYNELGKLYMAMGRYEESAEMFTQVTTIAPDSFRGYSNLGGAYLALGRNTDAVTALRRSIEVRPTYAAYSNLGTALFLLRQYVKAADSYKAALALNDKDYVVWGNLADAWHYAGRQAEEKIPFGKAISLALARLEVNPIDPPVHADLAMYYATLGKRDRALTHLQKALQGSKHQDPELIFDAAVVYHDCGERDQAIEWVGKALAAGYSPTEALNAPPLEDLHSDPRFQSFVKAAALGHK